VGAVLVLAAGGFGIYLAASQHSPHLPQRQHHRHAGHAPPAKVRKVQAVGIIDVGPVSHPLKLQLTAQGVTWVAIARSEIRAGVPVWTDNQMSDGTDIFIYAATGQCLSAGHDPARVRLAHCDLTRDQRWRPVDTGMAGGQAFAEYSNASTGDCLTAPGRPGLATLAACGRPRLPTQEIAFWWNA
jgi:hypothetical protein